MGLLLKQRRPQKFYGLLKSTEFRQIVVPSAIHTYELCQRRRSLQQLHAMCKWHYRILGSMQDQDWHVDAAY